MHLIVKSSSVLNHQQENNYLSILNRISITHKRESKSYSLLLKYLNPNDNIMLFRGCDASAGKSSLIVDLTDDGFTWITKVDVDTDDELKNIIDTLVYPPEHFHIFLHEGLIYNSTKWDDFEIFFEKLNRLLKVGGRYISFSLLPQNIINGGQIQYFHQLGWKVQVHCCDEGTKTAEIETDTDSTIPYPVFLIVCTKMESFSNALEFCPSDTHIQHSSNLEDLANRVQSFQHLAMIENELKNLQNRYLPKEISFEFIDPNTDTKSTKYRIFVLDRQVETINKFAAFVVPQGRETDWMFKSKGGRSQFTYDAQFQRLVLILLGREHHFETLEIVKDELADLVLRLKPNDLPSNYQIPFLSFGDKIGQRRKEIHRGVGKFTGEFVVEDVEDLDEDGNVVTTRQLVYLSDDTFVETEVCLKQGEVDVKHPTAGYQMAMVDDLQQNLLIHDDLANVLAIGVGGGALPSYLNEKFPNMSIDAVEIDPEIVQVAQHFFGLNPGPNLKVHCADGLIFIRDLASDPDGMRYDCIILDVDCKDNVSPMYAPTANFVEPSFISSMKACLKQNGLLLINFLVMDDDHLRTEVIERFLKSFASVEVKKVQGELNEILVCCNKV